MKLCVDFTRLIPKKVDTYHGGGYYLYQIINGLLNTRCSILQLTILWPIGYIPRNPADEKLIHNMKIRNVYTENMWEDNYAQYDTLFLPLIDPWNFPKLKKIKIKCPNLRTVVTMHDLRILDVLRFDSINAFYYKYGIWEYLFHHIHRYVTYVRGIRGMTCAASSADILMTVSNFSMQQILKYARNVNINYYYQVVDYDQSLMVEESKDRRDYILFVSGNREEKNFLRSLESYINAVKNGTCSLPLYVTGSKDSLVTCIKRDKSIDKTIINEKVKFLGYVSEDEMQRLYAYCTFLLYTSKSEGFGLPALNAGIYGRPVVASNRTSVPEVLGSTALYVDPYDRKSIEHGIVKMSDEIVRGIYEKNALQYREILIEMMQYGQQRIIDELLREQY